MKSTLALSSAALLAVVNAQDPIYQGDLAEDISSDDWASVLDEANITRSESFTGKDVSEPYPGSDQDGWELTIALKDDLDNPDGDDMVTATTVTLSAPDGETEFDDSWRVCMHVFPVEGHSVVDGWGHEFRGDCNNLVNSECVDDLRKQGRNRFGEGCESWKITASCRRDLQDRKGWSTTINADNAEEFLGGNSSFFRRVDGTHDQDDLSIIQAAAVLPVAIVNVFGSASESDGDDEPYAEVRCLMPDTVEEGSEDPFPQEDGAAGLGRFLGWAGFTAAVAAFML